MSSIINRIMNFAEKTAPLATIGGYHFLSLFRSQDTQNQLNHQEIKHNKEIDELKKANELLKQQINNQNKEINELKEKVNKRWW